MIYLIVNADDLGSGQATDRAIFDCFERGIVSSASLLANGPSFVSAATEAIRQSVPIGVHLNLSEGRALSGPITGLTDALGEFPGKQKARQLLESGQPCTREVTRELAAQLQRVCELGLRPDHVDAHQHIYLFGSVADMLFPLLWEFGIQSVRLPQPADPACHDPRGELGLELAIYRRYAPAFRLKSKSAGLSTPDGLWGMNLLNRLTTSSLLRALERIPAGYWELMVHPGDLDPHNPFGGPERLAESRALCHPRVIKRVQERPMRLISFGDLP